MPTVHDVLNEYCSENQITPSNKDRRRIGQDISHFLKQDYGFRYPIVVEGVRLTMIVENDNTPRIVTDYPEQFKPEMIRIISSFYKQKATRQQKYDQQQALVPDEKNEPLPNPEQPASTDKKRTRKPVQKPAYSLKK